MPMRGAMNQRLVIVAGLLLVGCQLMQEPEVACTAIGCDSQVVFELDDGQLVPGFAYEIEACLDDGCETATVELREHGAAIGGANGGLTVSAEEDVVALILPDADYPGVHTARLRVRPVGGEAFEAAVETMLERSQPNGPDCPPVCWQATVEV
jgi:hypothetical protein